MQWFVLVKKLSYQLICSKFPSNYGSRYLDHTRCQVDLQPHKRHWDDTRWMMINGMNVFLLHHPNSANNIFYVTSSSFPFLIPSEVILSSLLREHPSLVASCPGLTTHNGAAGLISQIQLKPVCRVTSPCVMEISIEPRHDSTKGVDSTPGHMTLKLSIGCYCSHSQRRANTHQMDTTTVKIIIIKYTHELRKQPILSNWITKLH